MNINIVGSRLGHTYGNVWYLHYGSQKESDLYNYYFGFKDYRFGRYDQEEFRHQGFPYYWRWNNIEMPSTATVYRLMSEAKPGDPVTVEVIRNKEKIRLTGTAQAERKRAKVK